MPMNRKLYPKNWDNLARAIKEEAGWACQECGRPCRRPDESEDDLIERITGTTWRHDLWQEEETLEFGVVPVLKPRRFVLTVAHLNHVPSDCSRDNLKALCSVCHLRYDGRQMAAKKRLKAERLGQLPLLFGSAAHE